MVRPLTIAQLAELGHAPKHFIMPKKPRIDPPKPITKEAHARLMNAIIAGDVAALRIELTQHNQLTHEASDAEILAIIDAVRKQSPQLFTGEN